MFYLVNHMNSVPGSSVGSVISRHFSKENAEKADNVLQKIIKKNNGNNSYLPTFIIESKIEF